MRISPARPRVRAVFAAAAAAVALLAVACSGGAGNPGTGSGPGGITAQKMDSFAACMRGHGVLNFYPSPKGSSPSPASTGVVLSIVGYQVTVNPQTPQFQSGMKACHHILGLRPPSQAVVHKQFVQALKQTACMRSHGYPGWQDPSEGSDGQGLMVPGPPPGVDTSSPQFLKAAKTCGVGSSERRPAVAHRPGDQTLSEARAVGAR